MTCVKALSAAALLAVVGLLSFTEGAVYVFNENTNETVEFDGWPAQFGNFDGEYESWLQETSPRNACLPLETVPDVKKSWIALVVRGQCNFDLKVLHAQKAHYRGVIVVNNAGDKLFNMAGSEVAGEVEIPSVLVASDVGATLRSLYLHKINPNVTVLINNYFVPIQWHIYLYPFVIIVGICVFLLVVFMFIRYRRERHAELRRRLPQVNLNRLPTKKFKKGEDSYETCAICLDDYNDGDKLRILPCEHAYHCKCVDKWLTSRSRTCPVCKFSICSDDSGSESSNRRRHRQRRRRSHSRSTVQSEQLSSAESGDENAPLVTQLSQSGGIYGARGSSNQESPTMVFTPLQPRSAEGSDSENVSHSTQRVLLVETDQGEEPLPHSTENSTV